MTQEPVKPLAPMTVDEINVMTARARSLPPSGDQTHVIIPDGEDPWVFARDGQFFYCTVDRSKRSILISRFGSLNEMADAPLVEVWPGSSADVPEYVEIWAPELQFLDGKWYIYFALYFGDSGLERMYVIEGVTGDPQGEYRFKNRLDVRTDRWTIDGSVMEMPDGEKYFIWSGWGEHSNNSQNIYIARMANPWTIASDRVLISRPEYIWEKRGFPYINEGPQALEHNGRVFIIYSASGSWTDDYCLGQLTYKPGRDPLDPAAWRKHPRPVFEKTDTIFAPGHCSFVKTSDGTDWIIYHAARSPGAGWARQVRAKPFTWNEDGTPNFGTPI